MSEYMISIIIPVYNGEKSIRKCINQILEYKSDDLEVIVVDDGSTDNTSVIMKNEYIKSNINYFYKNNGGVSDARNFGINHSHGKYIIFVDVDDEIYMESMNELINLMEENENIDCLMGSYYSYRGNKIIKKQNYKNDIINIDDFFINIEDNISIIVTPWSKIYRANIIKENHITYDNTLSIGEDTLFNIEYFSNCKSICTVQNIIYRYNTGGVASSRTYHDSINFMYKKTYDAYKKLVVNSNFLFNTGFELMMSAIDHYIFNCKKNYAISKIIETLDLFEEIVQNDLFSKKISVREYESIDNNRIDIYYKLYKRKNTFNHFKRRIARCIRKYFRI